MRKIFKILIIIAIVLVSLFFVGFILVIEIMSSIGSESPMTNDSSSIENTYSRELNAEDNEIHVFESENNELSNKVTFSLLPQTKYVLDDETSILVKNLHRIGQTEEVPYRYSTYDTGLPYVTIGDSYLEIINHVEIISNHYKYSITINDCKISGRSHEDMAWHAIDSCEVNVQREDSVTIMNSESLYGFEKRLDTKSRSSTELFEINNIGNNFFKLRFLNQHLGTTDKEPYFNFVKSFNADFDIITNYGVQNIKAVNLWEENFVVIGPYKINYTILDIGNSNIKCKASCRNIFDIKMNVEIISDPKDHSMKIVEYNTAITQKPASAKNSNLVNKPEFIATKDIPHYLNDPRYSFVDTGYSSPAKYNVLVLPGESKKLTLHCKSDEYAKEGFVRNVNNLQILSKQLVIYDPESIREESWIGNTSWEVNVVNNGEEKGYFSPMVHCKKISSEPLGVQIDLGVSMKKLSCWDNFVLLENTSTNKFECVKPEHAKNMIVSGEGSLIHSESDEELADLYLSNKPIIYAQGKLVYDEDSKWSGSHYRLIPELLFGISWDQISEDEIVVHKENVTDELLDKKVRIKGIFIQDFTIHDYMFNSCYKCDEPNPGLLVKEVNLVN